MYVVKIIEQIELQLDGSDMDAEALKSNSFCIVSDCGDKSILSAHGATFC